MDITQVLLDAQSGDGAKRGAAELQLKQMEEQNLAMFIGTLATELANHEKADDSRRLAGLIIKNALHAKDEAVNKAYTDRWLALDPNAKVQIKKLIVDTLSSPQAPARHVCAQVLAKIASIELPANQWPDLIALLLANVTNAAATSDLKQSTLETLGYICEDIDPQILSEQSNAILTAVVHGMRKEEESFEVKLAATTALCNALEFAKSNFERQNERDFIMQVTCEATQAENVRVRVAAYECLVKIASFYYDKLAAYMHGLFNLTFEAIRKEEEEVAQQAVEFWSTVADEEIDLLAEAEEAEPGEQVERVCQNYIGGALKFLVPLLLETLTKQDEDADEDTWNVAMAAGTCLGLVANTVGDEVVAQVMPFVQQHVNSENWRFREAATLAFGSILEGPSRECLEPLVDQAVPVMVNAMKDPHPVVKDTTAWTLGRICELHPSTIEKYLEPLVQTFLVSLADEPRVANNICWAIHNLAENFDGKEDDTPSTAMSRFFQHLVTALIEVTRRQDADEHNLRGSAYEAINMLIQNAGMDIVPLLPQVVPLFATQLEATFAMPVVSSDDKEKQNELQGQLCGVLQVLIQRLDSQVEAMADQLMTLFLRVFSSRNATVLEEALMTVGALANALAAKFERYMPQFAPFLLLGLQNSNEHQVCSVAVGCVGDIARALEAALLPYCDEIIKSLLENLQNPYLQRTVKPPILSCFGDVAIAIGAHFEKYLAVVMNMLAQASGTQVDMEDYDMVEYLNQLREGILEAYTGIIQGLKGGDKSELFLPFVEGVVGFIVLIANDDNSRCESVTRTASGVLGDLSHALGAKVSQYVKHPSCGKLLKEAMDSENSYTKETGSWAYNLIQRH